MIGAFRIGLIVGAVAWTTLFTPAFAAVPVKPGTLPTTEKSCVSYAETQADMVAHGILVGELKPEFLARLKAAVIVKARNKEIADDAKRADKAYGAFGVGDEDHVIMFFTKGDCIVAAVIFEATELHDALAAK